MQDGGPSPAEHGGAKEGAGTGGRLQTSPTRGSPRLTASEQRPRAAPAGVAAWGRRNRVGRREGWGRAVNRLRKGWGAASSAGPDLGRGSEPGSSVARSGQAWFAGLGWSRSPSTCLCLPWLYCRLCPRRRKGGLGGRPYVGAPCLSLCGSFLPVRWGRRGSALVLVGK